MTNIACTCKNPNYNTNPGIFTTDQVFLLSITESNVYFSSDNERQCLAPPYRRAQGTSGRNSNCSWWLRSPGVRPYFVANVHTNGSIGYTGNYADDWFIAFRPALWIDCASIDKDHTLLFIGEKLYFDVIQKNV